MIYMPSLASLWGKQMWSFYWLNPTAAKLVICSAFSTKCHNSKRKCTFQRLHVLFYTLKKEGGKGKYQDRAAQACPKHCLSWKPVLLSVIERVERDTKWGEGECYAYFRHFSLSPSAFLLLFTFLHYLLLFQQFRNSTSHNQITETSRIATSWRRNLLHLSATYISTQQFGEKAAYRIDCIPAKTVKYTHGGEGPVCRPSDSLRAFTQLKAYLARLVPSTLRTRVTAHCTTRSGGFQCRTLLLKPKFHLFI